VFAVFVVSAMVTSVVDGRWTCGVLCDPCLVDFHQLVS